MPIVLFVFCLFSICHVKIWSCCTWSCRQLHQTTVLLIFTRASKTTTVIYKSKCIECGIPTSWAQLGSINSSVTSCTLEQMEPPHLNECLEVSLTDQGEPAVSYRWTGLVWEITGCYCRKITNHFKGIYRIYPNLIKENRKVSACNRLDLQTLEYGLVMPKNLPGHWSLPSSLDTIFLSLESQSTRANAWVNFHTYALQH